MSHTPDAKVELTTARRLAEEFAADFTPGKSQSLVDTLEGAFDWLRDRSLEQSDTVMGEADWLLGDELNGGLIRDLCFTVWSLGSDAAFRNDGTVHDWANDTLPTVQAGVARIRARLSTPIAPVQDEVGLFVQLLRQTLDLSDGLLDDMEESGSLQAAARAIIAECSRLSRQAGG